MSKLYKNWTVHNLIAHPCGEIMFLTSQLTKKLFGRGKRLYDFQNRLHDATIPSHKSGEGRG